MPKFNWNAARQAIQLSLEDLIKVKKQVYKMDLGFWEKLAGCGDERNSLLKNLNELENLLKTIAKYVEFNALHFSQDLQQHIYSKKVSFFDNLFGAIQILLCYLFPVFGLAYAGAMYLGFATAMSTTAKIVTGAVTGGVILIGSVVKTIYDANVKKSQLEKATLKVKNTIKNLEAKIKEDEETQDSD